MKTNLKEIGYLSKPYGFNGNLKATLNVLLVSEDFPAFIWIYIDGKPVPFAIEKAEFIKQSFIIKMEDVDTEETALLYKNTNIFCAKDVFNTYFEVEESLEDLVGFEVFDKNKGAVGIVDSIIENAIQPTLVLVYEQKEILVPYSEDIVLEVDFDNKKIHVETPNGLIDMYLNE